MTIKAHAPAVYLERADPAIANYYPPWLENIAPDATVEGSMLDGAVQGPEAIRAIVTALRGMYEHQQHKYAGPYGDNNGFLEDYVAFVRGEPLGCVVLVSRNAAGQTQHVVASYRPRSSVMLLSRLLRQKFADAPFADQFADGEP
jgi:hypothetical protein